jgi:hypothetical protein
VGEIIQRGGLRYRNRGTYLNKGGTELEKSFEHVGPKRKPGIACKKMGDEMVLYDNTTESIHTLNPTAHFIWDLCDGRHTQEEIVNLVTENFSSTEGHDVRVQVKEVLDHFRSEALLE